MCSFQQTLSAGLQPQQTIMAAVVKGTMRRDNRHDIDTDADFPAENPSQTISTDSVEKRGERKNANSYYRLGKYEIGSINGGQMFAVKN